ncbi:MAG: ABC transporter permease [Christensenellales bacterium]
MIGRKADITKNEFRRIVSNIYKKYGIVIIFVVMFIIAALLSDKFLKPSNLLNIIRQNSHIVILACGINMLIVTGMIDLSAGATMTLAGCLAAGVMVATGNIILCIAAGMIVGGTLAWINGYLITKFNLQPFISTLAIKYAIYGVIILYTGSLPILGMGPAMIWLGQGYIGPIPTPIILMFLFIFFTFVLMKYTKLGLYFYAIGGNATAAQASGINVNRQKRTAFLIHGMLAGFAGIVLMGRLNAGQPAIADAGVEFDAIIAVVVGGTSMRGGIGNIFGTLVGALIVGMINNILILMGVPVAVQYITKGLLIAGAVILDTITRKIKT